MAEGANVEVAHSLSEHAHGRHGERRWHRLVEVAEVAILAVVAVATAWSGFQAAQWDGEQSFLYGESSRNRFEAAEATSVASERLASDAALFTAWLQARRQGDQQLQEEITRRFTPSYRSALGAWLELDPFEDPDAPAAPSHLTAYRSPESVRAKALNREASELFSRGTEARETGDKYVRATVLFATVLFLVAIGQRFSSHAARLGVNAVAGVVLVGTLVSIAGLPRT